MAESVGGHAAAAHRDAVQAVLQVVPPLSTMTKKLVRQIESEVVRAAGTLSLALAQRWYRALLLTITIPLYDLLGT